LKRTSGRRKPPAPSLPAAGERGGRAAVKRSVCVRGTPSPVGPPGQAVAQSAVDLASHGHPVG
jgi:hypothetical protein